VNSISFEFVNPWFLLVFIPGAALALITHFRLKPSKRRNRNRITSLVLYFVVLTLSTLVLAGFTIKEEDSLKKKETFIVVDVSRSVGNQSDDIDKFVADLLKDVDGNNKVGIVTFSDGAAMASPLSTDVSGALNALKAARKSGSDKATDINEGLYFAASLFTNRKDAKIVLITDGIDTENNLIIYSDNVGDTYVTDTETILNTARALSNQGISIDTAYFEPVRYDKDMQINKIEFRKSVLPLEQIDITVTVQSHVSATATLSLFDRVDAGEFVLKDTITYDVKEGVNSAIKFEDFVFGSPGLHTLKVELSGYNVDQIRENNVYYSYVNIETDKDVLIVDGDGSQGEQMRTLLLELGYRATVLRPDSAELPKNASELTRYNEVILMNVALATSDRSVTLPAGYDRVLDAYVKNYGGGVLTTGGEDTYYYGGMDGTAFDSFLPIEVIPEENEKSAIMIMVDSSGSMYYDVDKGGSSASDSIHENEAGYNNTRMYYAKQALTNAAVTVFNKKDYIGVMNFGKNYRTIRAPLTPASQRGTLINAIDSIREESKGSEMKIALETAITQLRDTAYKVDKKHIIIVTDSDKDTAGDNFSQLAATCATYYEEYGITVSVIAIWSDMNDQLEGLVTAYSKSGEKRFYTCTNSNDIINAITAECKAATTDIMNVSETGYKTYLSAITPTTNGLYDPTKDFPQGGVLPDVSQYNGFTVKSGVIEAASAYNEKNSNYDAIYAAWTYGKGRVGSFASDLSHWAGNFYADPEARQFLKNAVMDLLPEDSIKSSMAVSYVKKNFTTEVYVEGDLDGGNNAVFITVTDPTGKTTVYDDALAVASGKPSPDKTVSTGQTDVCTVSIENTVEGLYTLYLEKYGAEWAAGPIDEITVYYTFSYSQEYNAFVGDDEQLLEFLSDVSTEGGGNMLSLSDFEYNHSLEYVTVVHDPKLVLSIIAIICFILMIIARKFNFKWPHEWFKKKEEAR